MKNLEAHVAIQGLPLWMKYISSIMITDFKKKPKSSYYYIQYNLWN